jgi:RNA polymerase sigma-70 factor, ECF subfamily
VAQLADLEALEGNTKNRNRSASAPAHSNLPRPAALNRDRNREILSVLPRLKRYARILTRDVAAADDLVQDCIARALEKIGLWEQGTDLRAWMFTILYREHISHTRRDGFVTATLSSTH